MPTSMYAIALWALSSALFARFTISKICSNTYNLVMNVCKFPIVYIYGYVGLFETLFVVVAID